MRLSTKDFPLAAAFEAGFLEIDPALLARLGENRARVERAQRNPLIGRAVGGPPWLSADEVRWLLLVCLRDLLAPEARASPELVTFLVDRLNEGFTPAVPRTGLGGAGEIIPLAHTFQTFLGVGTVLVDGVETPAAEVLAEPYEPGLEEAATLIQGSPLAETLAAFGRTEVQQVADLQTLTAAIAIDIIGAPQALYRPALAGDDQVLESVLYEIGGLLDSASVRPEVVQAPVSVRVAPRVIARLTRLNGELDAALRRSVPTGSPVDLGPRMDAVTAALVHLGEVSVRRTHRLLAVDPGPRAGLLLLRERAVGELHALRRQADSGDTFGGQEEAQAFALAAGSRLRDACARMFAITACELLTGSQTRFLAPGDGSPRLRAAYEWLSGLVPPLKEDRPLGPEVTALIAVLRDSYFNDLSTLD
ncbi:aromatic amino acid lyase [Amycolatopsis sp. NPDC057786]|uniref:aromatic amino acid lyase n=1 Tax=Amycolatopsis sp. NPDC057786 TaxID=3346250 RepID=UPI00366E07FB